MKHDTNLIISWGLAIMGTVAVVGWIAISLMTGTSTGTEVPISIISGLVGVLTGKNLSTAHKVDTPTADNAGKVTV